MDLVAFECAQHIDLLHGFHAFREDAHGDRGGMVTIARTITIPPSVLPSRTMKARSIFRLSK